MRYKTEMSAADNRRIDDVRYMNLHVAALQRNNISLALQIDQCRYFITVFNTEMQDNRHIVDAKHMYLLKFIYRSYIYKYISWTFNYFFI